MDIVWKPIVMHYKSRTLVGKVNLVKEVNDCFIKGDFFEQRSYIIRDWVSSRFIFSSVEKINRDETAFGFSIFR